MYIWIGIDVEKQLLDVKEKAIDIDRALAFKNSCFTLPMHISLKMSFPIRISEKEEIIKTISDYYATIKPFEIEINKIEKYEHIVWIRMKENEYLNKISFDLNDILLKKYKIGLHEYDLDYQFHTTLFMDDDSDKVNRAFAEIQSVVLPKTISANKFAIGTSESGDLGTFSIYRSMAVTLK